MGDFSRYTSFLEIAFGLNLLFGAWDGIYDKLSQLSRDSKSKGEQTLEVAKVDVGHQKPSRITDVDAISLGHGSDELVAVLGWPLRSLSRHHFSLSHPGGP